MSGEAIQRKNVRSSEVAHSQSLRAKSEKKRRASMTGFLSSTWQKDAVAHLAHSRGFCISFWPSVPPLQVAPSFACSVASLSRYPGR